MPPLREEEAVAAAILQRLMVERDGLNDREVRAKAAIEALAARIAQLLRDRDREEALNRDAGETIARLYREAADLAEASKGHDSRLAEAQEIAHQAAAALRDREANLL